MRTDNDHSVNPETGEVQADNSCLVCKIPVTRFKREYLELPDEIVAVLGTQIKSQLVLLTVSRVRITYSTTTLTENSSAA